MNIDQVDESEARRILRSLRSGATPTQYASQIFVGQGPWFDTARKMMHDTAIDEDFEVRFLRAAYGGGKTLFLRCLEEAARADGWVTAYVLLKQGSVELDKFDTWVREVARTVEFPDASRGMNTLLERAMATHLKSHGYDPSRATSLNVLERAGEGLAKFCRGRALEYDFSLALRATLEARFERDEIRLHEIAKWLSGGSERLAVDPARFGSNPHRPATRAGAVQLKQLGPGTADQLLRLLALLTKMSGQKGLMLSFDEVELLGTLPEKRLKIALQTLRELVDHTDPALEPPSTCLFVAATPEMFESPRMLPSYKALQDRVDKLPTSRRGPPNLRGTVIDLDATELGEGDLAALAERIMALYRKSGEDVPPNLDGQLKELVKTITVRRYSIARPRLLCRCLLDILDGKFGADMPQEIAARNEQMTKERQTEMRVKA